MRGSWYCPFKTYLVLDEIQPCCQKKKKKQQQQQSPPPPPQKKKTKKKKKKTPLNMHAFQTDDQSLGCQSIIFERALLNLASCLEETRQLISPLISQ